MKIIPHNKPTITGKEIQSISKILKLGWIAQGKEVEQFENDLCHKYLKQSMGHAVAFSNGTSALYVALIALGIKPRNEIIIPSYVCSSILNAIYLAQAKPILVDVNENDFNISFEDTLKKINKKTKAIIIPHTFGMPADMDKFTKLNIPIIEDCAQSIGSELTGKPTGNFGEISVFSFYASKVITTGYGGMAFSKDKNIVEKLKDYREFDCRETYKPRFNFQMSDIQAAIGRVQLKSLPNFLKKRKKIASYYYNIIPPDKTWPPINLKEERKKTNFYRFLIRTEKPLKIKILLEKQGIKTIIPIEKRELLHRYLKLNPLRFPTSEKISQTTLSIPIYPSLKQKEINLICKSVKSLANIL